MNDRAETLHDFVAIGAGPFNLGLACLAEPVDGLDGLVLEARDEIAWHPGMMLPDSTLQVPFLADLVSLADPTSPYSFLHHLKTVGRLYPFYIRESFYPLRAEYDAYCRWAAERLGSVRLGRHVEKVTWDGEAYVVRARTRDGAETYRARRLVLGTGTQPHVPDAVRGLDGPVLHSADYLDRKADLQRTGSITIIGSGQSAAEIYRDLLEDADACGYRLTWVTRSPRFFPMEYTKLTLEMTSPEYTRYFQALPSGTRDRLVTEQKGLYKGISADLVDDIYDTLYRASVTGTVTTDLLTGTALTGAAWDDGAGRYTLELHHDETDETFRTSTDSLVLATGYRAGVPGFVEPLRERIRWDEQGRYVVSPTYTIDADGTLFVQNAEEHTHGFVAPDLGMGAYRSSVIINRMCGREVYPVEERIAFQTFGAPATPAAGAVPADPGVTLEPLDVEEHLTTLHAWVTDPKAVFWMMQGASLAEVRAEYAGIVAASDHDAWLGRVDGVPAFLAETYDPSGSPLSGRYDVRPGDLGMHVLVGPTDRPVRGFTGRVLAAVMGHCFSDPGVDRVVVEPDVRNDAIAELNARAGFLVDREIQLPDKRAALSFCTRRRFGESPLGRPAKVGPAPGSPVPTEVIPS